MNLFTNKQIYQLQCYSKMYQFISLVISFCFYATTHSRTVAAFETIFPKWIHHQLSIAPRPSCYSNTNILVVRSQNENENEVDEFAVLRDEIEQMKRVALQKLNVLEEASSPTSTSLSLQQENVKDTALETDSLEMKSSNASDDILSKSGTEEANGEETFVEKIAVSNRVATSAFVSSNDVLYLLDDSNWKISLNIGREPNTWMPKDWGVSGDRMLLNLEIKFTDEQLYDREDFLGSIGGTRLLKVYNNELTVAPTIVEGARKVKVLNGGWRVAPGAGPMNTDLLRFYIEIEEQLDRKESDVFCPRGRIYCSCGYFPSSRQVTGFKEQLKQKLDKMILRAEALDDEIANEGPFSLVRLKKAAELFRLKVEMQETGEKLMSANVVEPNSSLLKLSQDGSVGLTKEGGVCCKVNKGFAIEYHILGKFSISSTE